MVKDHVISFITFTIKNIWTQKLTLILSNYKLWSARGPLIPDPATYFGFPFR